MTDRLARRMTNMRRSFIREILKAGEDPRVISFAGGLPSPQFFPVKEIAAASAQLRYVSR
jgi:2-aminoadipate transaminase